MADNRAALAVATQHRAAQTRARARAAIRTLDHNGAPVTFTAVATTAGVSRSLLYRDPQLRAEITKLRTTAGSDGASRPPAAQRSSDASVRQRLAAAMDDNRTLRRENARLRDQVAVLLADQRATVTARTNGPCS